MCLAAPNADAYDVKEIGSFHIGGEEVILSGLPERDLRFAANSPPMHVNPNGAFEVGQMYVQYVLLKSPKSPYPILMWHGGGLAGPTWETKPDGAEGWQSWFLHDGYDVYVSDAVERGRASWARYPEIYSVEPFFRPKSEAWELFRFGPAGSFSNQRDHRRPFPNVAFPVEAMDQFAKQLLPRWAINDERTQKAYDALVQRVCPCIIMAHSSGGPFAFAAAMHAPDRIKGVIAIEPAGAPKSTADLSALKRVPMLMVWGDNLDSPPVWPKLVPILSAFRDRLSALGANVDWMDLPARGIRGNSHMIMMDRNSDQVATLISDWISKNVK
jgi:pimeloyl-ACP methyl ester carboxylesterase